MWKRIFAVVAGLVVANLVIFAFELVGQMIYPAPAGLDLNDKTAVAAAIAALPAGAIVLLFLGYAVGSFAGGSLATLISGRGTLRPGVVVGALVTVGGILNLVAIPHPLWLAVASLAMYVPFAWLGGRVLLRAGEGGALTPS